MAFHFSSKRTNKKNSIVETGRFSDTLFECSLSYSRKENLTPENNTIEGIKACVFDAYGTLFDVHSAVGKHRHRLGDIADQVSNLWRTKQLEYTWLRSLMGHHTDFWKVTQDALDFAFDMQRTSPLKRWAYSSPIFEYTRLPLMA